MSGTYTATGLMSGTSMDGVDLTACSFHRDQRSWTFRILAAETIPYPAHLGSALESAMRWDQERIERLDHELGVFYGQVTRQFHKRNQLRPGLVASHGHTLFHQPEKGMTRQLGHGGMLAKEAGVTVVCDFRTADVMQGGQGAPLVPVGDELLFPEYGACLNLGGFANLSFRGPAGQRLAYDIGPANLALNAVAGKAGMKYDRDGELADQGILHRALLEEMNKLEYYQRKPPKSLGREWFLEHFFPLIESRRIRITDLMATTSEHIAFQAGQAIRRTGADRVLATGGGALNRHLVSRLQHHSGSQIRVPEKKLVNYKEALVFALLGILRTLGEVNCLASVTGGKEDLSTGRIYTI